MNAVEVAFMRAMSATHVLAYRVSAGRLGGRIPGGTKVLLLTTTGRKSGKVRTTPLLYVGDGDRFVIIASKGGHHAHPAWWLNLNAAGKGKIQAGKHKLDVTVAEAEGEERERLWREMTKLYPTYDSYQQKTDRKIPVVVLTPN